MRNSLLNASLFCNLALKPWWGCDSCCAAAAVVLDIRAINDTLFVVAETTKKQISALHVVQTQCLITTMAIPSSLSKSVETDGMFGGDPGLKQGLLCHESQRTVAAS